MKYIGLHVSTDSDISQAPVYAHTYGATAFACDLVGLKYADTAPLTDEVVKGFVDNCTRYGYTSAAILPHSSFMVNLGNPDKRKNAFSRKILVEEMRRCQRLGITMINFHPGASLGVQSVDECLELIAASVNRVLEVTEGVKAVLENTAGQGTAVGYTFEQLAAIIDRVEDKSRVGVCVDSCHAFAAGYDLATPEGYDKAWSDFETTVGFGYLSAMHINDSMRGLGSRIDRHAPMGRGAIGVGFFERLMTDSRMDGRPFILETPDENLWADEIAALKIMAGDNEPGS